jgi:hypothetical protein
MYSRHVGDTWPYIHSTMMAQRINRQTLCLRDNASHYCPLFLHREGILLHNLTLKTPKTWSRVAAVFAKHDGLYKPTCGGSSDSAESLPIKLLSPAGRLILPLDS